MNLWKLRLWQFNLRSLFVAITALAVVLAIYAVPEKKPILSPLFKQLNSDDRNQREKAADELATIVDPRITVAGRKRLRVETDFHVQLALHRTLACQGEKASLQFLINALHQTGHLGSNYLGQTTGEDFGWNIGQWQQWYNKTTDKEFLAFIRQRWERKPMMDEWGRFQNLHAEKFFSRLKKPTTGKSFAFDTPLSDEERKELEELPTTKAWQYFSLGIKALQEDGNRPEAARLFRKVATEYSKTYYAEQSKELADLLDQMVEEDNEYVSPESLDSLDMREQIAYHIYHLRDVVAHQYAHPGDCNVLDRFSLSGKKSYNAAFALREMGEPAAPFLFKLLEDRRPIRAVGYWRNFIPERTVLRYQDAAYQILSAIRSDEFVNRPINVTYISTAKPERQKEIIEFFRASLKKE